MIQETTEQTPTARPLYLPERDDAYVPSVSTALTCARQALARHQHADIHDRDAMVRAAVALEIELRHLVGALDAAEAALCSGQVDAWRKQVAA